MFSILHLCASKKKSVFHGTMTDKKCPWKCLSQTMRVQVEIELVLHLSLIETLTNRKI